MPNESANPSLDALTRDFLVWITSAPRTHADVMDVWRSSCPRITVWEDALIAGLVEVDGASMPQHIVITPAGRAMLNADGATHRSRT
jgi:hypothetical protein